ncbi:tRNA1(Val) A37 N6-methylase TrmN6 [Pedobacter sp. UYEF25]
MKIDQIMQTGKKELGQFFSGKRVGRMLAYLTRQNAKDIIDPMCGTGDLLLACAETIVSAKTMTGVEIDHLVYEQANKRTKGIKSSMLIQGNAFARSMLKKFSPNGYDLVITNPPYVRHQEIKKSNLTDALAMDDIRINLISELEHFNTLSVEDKEEFRIIISSYSGLSDLAVPSWILCAMLVKESGQIALVVPETWLSRDYASIIKYILLKWFKIDYIVEDANASWFKPTQVKTTLLVATRIKKRNSILSWTKESFSSSLVYKTSMNDHSLVGKVYPDAVASEIAFVKAITNGQQFPEFFESKHTFIKDFATDLLFAAQNYRWYKLLENTKNETPSVTGNIKRSSYLRQWHQYSKVSFFTLQELGVEIGQGLRTGANNFFYLSYNAELNEQILIAPREEYNMQAFQAHSRYFSPVLRRQSDLKDNFCVHLSDLNHVALSLQHYILPEDFQHLPNDQAFSFSYEQVPRELARYIKKGAEMRNGGGNDDPLFPELSAVKTNVRKWNSKRPSEKPRFWYMLPEFKARHKGSLVIPRVNSSEPKTRINIDNVLIDANFSTLWIVKESNKYSQHSLLALLNSTWAIVSMELYGTVMGGGALKLEATQLKKIPFPSLSDQQLSSLHLIGKKLSQAKDKPTKLINKIDSIILESFEFGNQQSEKLKELSNIKANLLKKRIK